MEGIIAIDLGAKKTGFAYADPLRIAIHPLETVRINEDDDRLLEHLQALVEERDVNVLLVGVALREGGRPSARHAAVDRFTKRLRARFPELEVRTHDERLTTKEAEAQLFAAGFRGKDAQRRKDSWAALVLLRDFLNL